MRIGWKGGELAGDAFAERGAEAVELHRDGGCFPSEVAGEIFERSLLAVAGVEESSGGILEFSEAFVKRFESRGFAIALDVELDLAVEVGKEFVGESDGRRAEFPAMIGEEIRRDALEPWLEGSIGVAVVDFPESGDEDFLGEVLDIVMVPQADGEVAADTALMTEDKRGESGGITILRRADESRFVVGVRGVVHGGSVRCDVVTSTGQHGDGEIS